MIHRVSFGTRDILCSLIGLTWCLVGCTFLLADSEVPLSPRDAMRTLVVELAEYTRTEAPVFLVIAQNGEELLTTGDTAATSLASDYVAAVDGLGREDLLYGYSNDNGPTPVEATNWMLAYLGRAEELGIEVLVTDYCWDQALMDDSYSGNAARGFVSFAAPSRELDTIPDDPAHPFKVHSSDVISLSDVRNFLYLINPRQFETKASFLDALTRTNYDALILDLEFDGAPLSAADVSMLKIKANGGTRLVLCYVSIGEAEDYREYWDPAWSTSPPEWLLEENPDWPGNYPVHYWHPEWREIVFGMMDAVLSVGFDGVYLDRIDVYEKFEK